MESLREKGRIAYQVETLPSHVMRGKRGEMSTIHLNTLSDQRKDPPDMDLL